MATSYERFFQLSLDMLATAGFDGFYKDLNPAWQRVLGWSIDELKSKPFVEFVHPDDRQKTIDETQNLGKPGHETIGFENRYLCKDGSYKWLAWRAAVSADEGLIYATARDVTDYRKTSAESRLLRTLLDTTTDMIGMAEVSGKPVYLNPAGQRMLGISPDGPEPEHFAEGAPRDELERLEREVMPAVMAEGVWAGESLMSRRDGSRVPVSQVVVALRDDDGQVTHIGTIARDISGQKESDQARDKAVRELMMLQGLVNATNDFVAVADPEGNSLFVNPGGLSMLGWDHFPGGKIPLYQPPAAVAQLDREAFPTVMASGRWQGESELMHRDGTAIPVSQVITAIRDASGDLLAFGTIARDIRDWKRLEAELRRRHAVQQEALHAMATPIIQVWDQIVSLPVVGIVDSVRASDMKDALLGAISRFGARYAIVDLTGVETVDTATADHLLRVMRSVRLLGAQGIITGIQPQVSQIMVALGVDMREVVTLRSLREGLRFCLKRMGYRLEQIEEAPVE